MYKGIGASAGIGIGKIVKIKEEELNYTKQNIEDGADCRKRGFYENIIIWIIKY